MLVLQGEVQGGACLKHPETLAAKEWMLQHDNAPGMSVAASETAKHQAKFCSASAATITF